MGLFDPPLQYKKYSYVSFVSSTNSCYSVMPMSGFDPRSGFTLEWFGDLNASWASGTDVPTWIGLDDHRLVRQNSQGTYVCGLPNSAYMGSSSIVGSLDSSYASFAYAVSTVNSGGYHALYMNGTLVASSRLNTFHAVFSGGSRLWWNRTETQTWKLDNAFGAVRLWHGARSPEQIASTYMLPTRGGVNSENLVGEWLYDNVADGVLRDSVGTMTGSIVGIPLQSGEPGLKAYSRPRYSIQLHNTVVTSLVQRVSIRRALWNGVRQHQLDTANFDISNFGESAIVGTDPWVIGRSVFVSATFNDGSITLFNGKIARITEKYDGTQQTIAITAQSDLSKLRRSSREDSLYVYTASTNTNVASFIHYIYNTNGLGTATYSATITDSIGIVWGSRTETFLDTINHIVRYGNYWAHSYGSSHLRLKPFSDCIVGNAPNSLGSFLSFHREHARAEIFNYYSVRVRTMQNPTETWSSTYISQPFYVPKSAHVILYAPHRDPEGDSQNTIHPSSSSNAFSASSYAAFGTPTGGGANMTSFVDDGLATCRSEEGQVYIRNTNTNSALWITTWAGKSLVYTNVRESYVTFVSSASISSYGQITQNFTSKFHTDASRTQSFCAYMSEHYNSPREVLDVAVKNNFAVVASVTIGQNLNVVHSGARVNGIYYVTAMEYEINCARGQETTVRLKLENYR